MNASDASNQLFIRQFVGDTASLHPGYPDEALAWAVGDAREVLDVGAGHGALTGQLLQRGLAVHAVEPDPIRSKELNKSYRGARQYFGVPEALPLDDGSVDAVLSAASWRWFARDEVAAEVARVLRPGGHLTLISDRPVPERPWEFELAGLKAGRSTEPPAAPDVPGAGGEPQVQAFDWGWQILPAQVPALLVANSSELMALPGDQRAARFAEVQRDVESDAGADGRAAMARRTTCVRWDFA